MEIRANTIFILCAAFTLLPRRRDGYMIFYLFIFFFLFFILSSLVLAHERKKKRKKKILVFCGGNKNSLIRAFLQAILRQNRLHCCEDIEIGNARDRQTQKETERKRTKNSEHIIRCDGTKKKKKNYNEHVDLAFVCLYSEWIGWRKTADVKCAPFIVSYIAIPLLF